MSDCPVSRSKQVKQIIGREAKRLFADLARRGQQLADEEQRKFVIVRDPEVIYKLRALSECTNYAQRSAIVKRIKPRTPSGDSNNGTPSRHMAE